MTKKFIIGLDIGTSSIKGIMIASDSSERFTGRVPFTYTTNPDGKVEIPAEDYLESCFELLREFSSKLPENSPSGVLSFCPLSILPTSSPFA